MEPKSLMQRDIDFMVDLAEMAKEMNLSREDVRFLAKTYRENRQPDIDPEFAAHLKTLANAGMKHACGLYPQE